MMISRRHFLLQSVASAVGLFYGLPQLARSDSTSAAIIGPSTGEIFLIGDGARGNETLAGSATYAPRPGRVRIWRFGQKGVTEISLPFLPHAFASHPQFPHRIVTFEKWGRALAEIDLEKKTVLRVTSAQQGRRFFGHGAHSGQHIYATQMDDEKGIGSVAVLEADTHRLVKEYPTRGVYPHDCQWLPGTRTLLIVNSRRTRTTDEGHGNDSSVIWLDTETGNIIKQVFIEKPEFGYAHFARASDGTLVLAGSYDPPRGRSQPLIAVVRPDDSVQVLKPDPGLRGEALSIYLHESNQQAVVTLPGSSIVQVWNYQSGKFIRQFELGEARGLAYSTEQKQILMSSASARGYQMLDEALRVITVKPVAIGLGGSGSHLLRVRI